MCLFSVWRGLTNCLNCILHLPPIRKVIAALLVTILIEGMVVACYAIWRKKPVKSLLLTSILGNLVTQSMLWIMLNLFYRQYLISLTIGEILVWMIESLILYVISANKLTLAEAAILSLVMNISSLAIGWFTPV